MYSQFKVILSLQDVAGGYTWSFVLKIILCGARKIYMRSCIIVFQE